MEKVSLKALANKVLSGNSQGNLPETEGFQGRKPEGVKTGEVSSGGNDSILPEERKYTYEERAGIMEYDGGLDWEEAERQSWCIHACMLFTVSQWKMCEKFKPKQCLKLTTKGGKHVTGL
jgi:hypothetical protein